MPCKTSDMIKQLSFFLLAIAIPLLSYCQHPETIQQIREWKFSVNPTWQDEFDKNGLPDSSKWSYDIGGSGWGNNEKQYYTNDKNAVVTSGILNIIAKKEDFKGMDYTSARMVTKNKGDFLYGRIEVKAQLPTGRGSWPAIWMLPSTKKYGGWPNSGEIDIMEQVGYDEKNIHFSIHNEAFNWPKNTQKTAQKIIPTACSDFHIYRMDWTPDYIMGFIDGEEYFNFKNDGEGAAHWPFDEPFYLILNIAVGGNWGGQKGIDDSIFPAKMLVDYVRYYSLEP